MAEQRVVRVLLVEDNPHVAELIVDGFDGAARRELGGRIGFVFSVVEDGQAGLDQLREEPPDLVICDVLLPVLDGDALMRRLRQEPRTAATPIIALSAGGPAARKRAEQAGADVYLEKPIRLQELFDATARLIGADSPR